MACASHSEVAQLPSEADKQGGWADDPKVRRERALKHLDRLIEAARCMATALPTPEVNLAGEKRVKALEARRNEWRR